MDDTYIKARTLSTTCWIRQYGEQYCDTIIHHIVNFDNIITIYDNNIGTQNCENCQYCDYIAECSPHMVKQ